MPKPRWHTVVPCHDLERPEHAVGVLLLRILRDDGEQFGGRHLRGDEHVLVGNDPPAIGDRQGPGLQIAGPECPVKHSVHGRTVPPERGGEEFAEERCQAAAAALARNRPRHLRNLAGERDPSRLEPRLGCRHDCRIEIKPVVHQDREGPTIDELP